MTQPRSLRQPPLVSHHRSERTPQCENDRLVHRPAATPADRSVSTTWRLSRCVVSRSGAFKALLAGIVLYVVLAAACSAAFAGSETAFTTDFNGGAPPEF